jgi:hypothetical protein
VDDKGHSFCNNTCSTGYADLVKEKNDKVSVHRACFGVCFVSFLRSVHRVFWGDVVVYVRY